MIYLYSIIFGLIQALTEFLPISSSGHLVIFHDILNFGVGQSLSFDVALHLGTAFASIIYFRQDILKYAIAILTIFVPKRQVNQTDLKDALLIIYASIPAVIIGFLFEEAIEKVLRQTEVVIVSLIIGALLFFAVEKFGEKTRDFTGMHMGRALYIGFAQCLALIPGVSRSGITMTAGMSVNLKRMEAAKFSFLLSIPIVLGAGIYKLIGLNWSDMIEPEKWSFVIGFLISGLAGFIVIKYLLKFLGSHKLNGFGWYRIGLALILIGWLFVK